MIWRKLTSISEFDEILMQSSVEGSAFVLFKHSTRCMVSTMALRSFESEFDSEIPAYFLDLIKYRDLSNYISSRIDIQHQSPQVITVNNGDVVYSDSHYHISAEKAISL